MSLFWPVPTRSGWYLARFVEIWPIFGQIRWNLARSRQDLAGSHRIWTRSRRDFARSRPIWWVLSKFSSNSFKYRRILYVFVEEPLNIARSFWVYDRVGLLEFWESKTANRPEGVGFHGRRPATDRRSVILDDFRFRLGWVGWVSWVYGLGGQS